MAGYSAIALRRKSKIVSLTEDEERRAWQMLYDLAGYMLAKKKRRRRIR